MHYPVAFSKEDEIRAAVAELEKELAPDVVRIRYEIGQDHNENWAIFFRVVLPDLIAKHRLRDVADNVIWSLRRRLDFEAMGVFSYHNFRSVSEQAELREPAWA